MARVQLNDAQTEDVVGGIFDFYTNKKGERKCAVEGIGTYYASADAFDWFVQYTCGDKYTAQEVVDEGFRLGYFSNSPI